MKKGFTIIESIVALTIIIAAVVGPFMLVTRGILASKSAKNRLIASNMAQEGIEMIRYFRDSNILASCVGTIDADGDGNLDPNWRAPADARPNCTPLADNGAGVHWETDASFDLSDIPNTSRLAPFVDVTGDRVLKFCRLADNAGLYAYACPNDTTSPASLLNTTFKRRIKISGPGSESVTIDGNSVIIPAADRLRIDVTILWQDGAVARTLTQTEVLYNWR